MDENETGRQGDISIAAQHVKELLPLGSRPCTACSEISQTINATESSSWSKMLGDPSCPLWCTSERKGKMGRRRSFVVEDV
jgi:hypothetical protein